MPNRIITPRAIHPRHSLLDGLVAFWPMCESGGDRVDLVGGMSLTDNNTVGQSDGKIGKAALFTPAQNEFFSIPDSPKVSVGDGGNDKYALTAWILLNGTPTTGNGRYLLFGRNSCGGPATDFEFDVIARTPSGTTVISHEGTNNAGTYALVDATFPGGFSTGVWYFLYVFADGSNIGASINNSAPVTSAWSGALRDGGESFRVGSLCGTSLFFDGRMQNVGFWKGRALTQPEVDWQWNAGNGRPFPWRA
ncbi:MAG: LamG-like jellyroll fold domain-containing protein [Blastocatellales bacterium]